MRILLLTLLFVLTGCAAQEYDTPTPVEGPKTLQQVQAEQKAEEERQQAEEDAATDAAVQAAIDAMMSVATQ